jgi:hypothetical protein
VHQYHDAEHNKHGNCAGQEKGHSNPLIYLSAGPSLIVPERRSTGL